MIRNLLAAILALCGLAPALACSNPDNEVRILIAYSTEAAAMESNWAILAGAHRLGLNNALTASGVKDGSVTLQTKIVGYYAFAANEPLRPDPMGAWWDASQSLGMLGARELLCADVVAVYHPTNNGSTVDLIGSSYASAAMFVVDMNTYSPRTFSHEFGHLLGARHQASGGLNPTSNDPDPGNANGHYIRAIGVWPPARPYHWCANDIGVVGADDVLLR